jgi:hypothetical protein
MSKPNIQHPAARAYPEADEQPTFSHPIYLRSTLTLSFHLCLGLTSSFLSSDFVVYNYVGKW